MCIRDSIFIDCSLIDTKQQLVLVDGSLSLVQFLHFILASLQPSCRTVDVYKRQAPLFALETIFA